MKKGNFFIGLILLFVPTTGCYHVAFDPSHSYSIESTVQDEPLTVVVDQETLAQEVSIRSWMAGIANSWNIQPGMMLKQVADIEFPQMFRDYQTADFYEASLISGKRMVLELSILQYGFADFHATIEVQAIAHGPDGSVLFDKSYREEGFGQGGKMFWGGPFGMKSAIRQSSLDAYKKIFTRLRSDLSEALTGGGPTVRRGGVLGIQKHSNAIC